ncbi:MAG: hypothetical protein ACI33N_07885 [Desulfovibrionaceae bacterium]
MAKRRQTRLLGTLEKRLDRLTEGLNLAEVTDKSIEIVKEIKELSSILKAMRDTGAEESSNAVTLLWADEQLPRQ